MIHVKTQATLNWYLNRLRKMPLKEIPYRLNQFLRIRRDKYFFPPTVQWHPSSKLPGDDISSQFRNGFGNKPDLSSIDKTSLIRETESILRHEFEVFGIKTKFGPRINFHLDIKTGRTWPLRFWNDINHRDGKTVGGIKFAWQFNRLNHWPKMAIAYSLTEDQRYLQELLEELDDWLKSNPYPLGINWISGIEVGIRLVNLFYSLKIIGLDALKEPKKELISKFVSLHARHLYRYPSKYSSCANHSVGEALGLFVAGLAFPFLENSHKWKAFGQEVLERELLRQIYLDGSSFEHSTPYLQFVADHFLIYYLICKEYKETFKEQAEECLKAVCNFISCIVDINGNIPIIGDGDDGFLLKLWFGEHKNFLSLLSTGSILFYRPDWVHPSASLDTKTLFLLGSSARPRWEKLKNKKAWRRKSCYFNNAGLAIIAHHKSQKEILFVGNSGPLGLKPLAGHGHSDALSFWLSVNGQPFFVDPGTYLYHSGGRWRHYFRSTAAHNTVQIDTQDQAEQLTDFMFGDPYHIRNINFSEGSDTFYWGAEHDGYQRLPDPVVHRREITYLKRDQSFRMVDLLKCRGRHDVKLLFHLHPNVTVRSEGDNTYRLSTGTASIVLRVDNKLEGQVFSGSEDPLMGWYSPGFNHLEKTTSLVFHKQIDGDSVFHSEVKIL